MTPQPIALTIGEPAGIGPELAGAAWHALRGEVPFFLIGDPTHLPDETDWVAVAAPDEVDTSGPLPVLVHAFDGPRVPGQPSASHAKSRRCRTVPGLGFPGIQSFWPSCVIPKMW